MCFDAAKSSSMISLSQSPTPCSVNLQTCFPTLSLSEDSFSPMRAKRLLGHSPVPCMVDISDQSHSCTNQQLCSMNSVVENDAIINIPANKCTNVQPLNSQPPRFQGKVDDDPDNRVSCAIVSIPSAPSVASIEALMNEASESEEDVECLERPDESSPTRSFFGSMQVSTPPEMDVDPDNGLSSLSVLSYAASAASSATVLGDNSRDSGLYPSPESPMKRRSSNYHPYKRKSHLPVTSLSCHLPSRLSNLNSSASRLRWIRSQFEPHLTDSSYSIPPIPQQPVHPVSTPPSNSPPITLMPKTVSPSTILTENTIELLQSQNRVLNTQLKQVKSLLDKYEFDLINRKK